MNSESMLDVGEKQAGLVETLWNKLSILEEPRYLKHLLLVPVLIFFIVWNVIPLFWLLGLSFYKYVLVLGEPIRFIGGFHHARFDHSKPAHR